MHYLSRPLLCIAHRGGSEVYTENSLKAFAHALALGADALELDVWLIDGQLFVTHDRRLGNTLPGHGRLIDQTAASLSSIKLPCGQNLATLWDVLTLVGDTTLLNIELKGPNCADAVAKELTRFTCDSGFGLDQYVVSSFDHQQLYRFKQQLPSVRLGVLTEGVPLHYAAIATELEAYCFSPSLNFASQELIDDAKQRGLKTWVYTVNHEDDMHWVADMGVDGIFTDFPSRLQQLNPLSAKPSL